jgi:signal transduction histidine kinase
MVSFGHPSADPVGSPGSSVRRRVGWGSVERQLPLLMSGVVAAILAITLVMVHATLTESAQDVAAHRLDAAGRQLSTVYANALTGARNRALGVADDSAIVNALVAAARSDELSRFETPDNSTPAEGRLRSLLTRADSTLTAELWTADGRRVAWVGRDVRAGVTVRPQGTDVTSASLPHDGLEGLPSSDSGEVGRLYLDDGRVHLWVVAPVDDGTRRLGYVTRQYRLATGDQVQQFIRGLTDAEIGIYLRNASGDVWSTISGATSTAPTLVDSASEGVIVTRPRQGELLSVQYPLQRTPLALVLEMPLDAVLAGTRATLTKLALIGVLLTLFGAVLSWRVSRRFTTPLAALTSAAESFTAGNYGARVQPQGGDELVRLGTTFNRMVEEAGASRSELEMQTAEAEAARGEAERTRVQAEAANRAKSDFLRVMSHELRTPLNAIGGYTELMELELRGPITEEQRRDLGRIRASQQHLLGLISGVLDLSRIESGRVAYRIESIALDPFLSAIEDLVGPQASAKTVTLEYIPPDASLAVRADAEKLRQIMLNLISNAIRHTPAQGRIALAAGATSDSTIGITVTDTGGGIAADALERIFEPFVQLDRTLTSLHEGLGLGLSISRDLARGMHGDLTVESQPGHGSRFTLSLPRAEIPSGRPVRPLSGDYPTVERRPVS